jgi:hypothetical protein
VLDINRDLRTENNVLQEKLKSLGHCSTHAENVAYLKRKVDEYEHYVIPQLKL